MSVSVVALAVVAIALCSSRVLSQDINWLSVNTPTENRPRFREDAHLFRLSLDRLALFGGLTGKKRQGKGTKGGGHWQSNMI